jgi:hypothetical protein
MQYILEQADRAYCADCGLNFDVEDGSGPYEIGKEAVGSDHVSTTGHTVVYVNVMFAKLANVTLGDQKEER